jgi:hypothetical protein
MENPHFRDMYEGLKDAALAMADAGRAIIAATEALTRSIEAAQRANAEQEDLRETVTRLETLIMELIRRQNGGSDLR